MKEGFKVIRHFLEEELIKSLEKIALSHHEIWKKTNQKFYEERAINSAYLTHINSSSAEDRLDLFKLITDDKIINELDEIFGTKKAKFLNTQLFFDPVNKLQKNYWHRDIQYTSLPLEAQKTSVEEDPCNVVHFRLALRDEEGIELIPGTHSRWDTDEEMSTRLGKDGRNSFDELPGAQKIPLKRGDLLIFSANMIHRGLYGMDRFALDIIYCKEDPEILSYADEKCYPNSIELEEIQNKFLFDIKPSKEE